MVSLSDAEKEWLQDHPIIKVAQDPAWPPLEYADAHGRPTGMSEDYLELIEQRLGVRFERVTGLSWQDAYEMLGRWEIDMTTSVAATSERAGFWAFTQPYLTLPVVILTRSDVLYVGSLDELSGMEVAVVDGYVAGEWIARDFPAVQLIEVATVRDGLELLQGQEVSAFVDNLLVAGHYMTELKMSDLKVAGQTPYVSAQCMAVRKDWAPLVGILQKGLDSISQAERAAIYSKWVPIRYEHGFNYTPLWWALGAFVIFAGGMFLWVGRLMGEIRRRKRAEEALVHSEEQLRQSQKMEAIGQLAGGIAHDFNNLLTAILGYGELLLSGPELADSPARKDIKEINRAAERAAALTRQILAFSRRQALRPAVVSLNDVLSGLEPLLRRTLGEDVNLVVRLESDLGQTEIDVHQFEQVLMNLAVNARDAMPAGGQLTLETANVELDHEYCRAHPEATPGSFVMLAVSDTGIGMDQELRSHIFEPFFTTKPPGTGTGLGLATVYGIVRQSGGSINLYSELGKGTSFKIYLPRVTSVKEATHMDPEPSPLRTGEETILVVEDEAALRDLSSRVLGAAGYTVLTAASAEEALQIVGDADGSVDLLLTDVVLPGGMQGDDLAQFIKTSWCGLPVLFMSGYARSAVMHGGRIGEATDFLEKPFTPDALAAKVREVLDRGRSAEQ